MADRGRISGSGGGSPSRSVPTDCDSSNGPSETLQLANTLFINAVVFVALVLFFEVNRHMRSIYQKRLTKEKLVQSGRTPPAPPRYLFGWLMTLARISEDDLLHMVGLDGYMLLRYINICFRISLFLTFWGVVVLVPVYGNSAGKNCGWSRFTLANVPNDYTSTQLWAPSVLAYLFAFYFCHMMHAEYQNFLEKRVEYLIQGDPSTPSQAYYTVMVERIPAALRAAPKLKSFFEHVFPGDVYCVELAAELGELDAVIEERHAVRDKLEKSIALFEATGVRPTLWVSEDVYADAPDPPLPFSSSSSSSSSSSTLTRQSSKQTEPSTESGARSRPLSVFPGRSMASMADGSGAFSSLSGGLDLLCSSSPRSPSSLAHSAFCSGCCSCCRHVEMDAIEHYAQVSPLSLPFNPLLSLLSLTPLSLSLSLPLSLSAAASPGPCRAQRQRARQTEQTFFRGKTPEKLGHWFLHWP